MLKRILIICLLLATPCLAAVESFGIFSPIMGIQENMPSILISQAFTNDNENVELINGEIRRCQMRADVLTRTTDQSKVLKYYLYEQADGDKFLLAFCPEKIYYWNTSSAAWDDVTDPCNALTEATHWSVVTFNNSVYASNNIDKIITWSGTGDFGYADTASGLQVGESTYLTRAAFLSVFEGYLIAGNVTTTGGTYPSTIYWSDTEDPCWDGGNASNMTLPGPWPFTGAGLIDDFLMIFSGYSIDLLWAVDSSLLFNTRRHRTRMGTFAPDSIVNGQNGELFFLDNTQNIRMVRSAMSEIEVVSRPIDKTTKQIPQSLVNAVCGTYIPTLEQMWWAVPYGIDATGNNKVICLDVNGAWTKRDMDVTAFGQFENISGSRHIWGYDPCDPCYDASDASISNAFPTWDEWQEQWDSIQSLEDEMYDLCSDYDGYSYKSHASGEDSGDTFTGYAIIGSDFSSAKGTPYIDRYKRLVGVSVFFNNTGTGDAQVELRCDTAGEWYDLDMTVDLSSSEGILWHKINCDYRARYFELKVSGDNHFEFIGAIFYFIPESLR